MSMERRTSDEVRPILRPLGPFRRVSIAHVRISRTGRNYGPEPLTNANCAVCPSMTSSWCRLSMPIFHGMPREERFSASSHCPVSSGATGKHVKGRRKMMRSRRVLLASGVGLALSAGAAAAAPAVVRADLNMRSGPGTNYAVVETIPGGAMVEVLGCTGSWCRVTYAGETGYAGRSYLGVGRAGAAAVIEEDAAPPTVAYGYPGYSDDPSYYDYGPSVRAGVGIYRDGWRDGGWRYGRNFRYGNVSRGRDGNWSGRDGTWPGRSSAGPTPGGPRASGNFGSGGGIVMSGRGNAVGGAPAGGGAGGNVGAAGGGGAAGGSAMAGPMTAR
jgi:uncharacterized protein YraI